MGSVPTREPAEVVDFHKRIVDKLMESEEVVSALSSESGEVDVGLALREPNVRLRLTIDVGQIRVIALDPKDESVDDPTILMDWDTAYGFWKGELDLLGAIFSGEVKVEGKTFGPLLRLEALVPEAIKASRKVVEELGWD